MNNPSPKPRAMSQLKQIIDSIPDNSIIDTTRTTTVVSGVGGGIASIADWNWTAIVGVTLAILSFLVNYYFSKRKDRRNKELIDLQKELIRAQIADYNKAKHEHTE